MYVCMYVRIQHQVELYLVPLRFFVVQQAFLVGISKMFFWFPAKKTKQNKTKQNKKEKKIVWLLPDPKAQWKYVPT